MFHFDGVMHKHVKASPYQLRLMYCEGPKPLSVECILLNCYQLCHIQMHYNVCTLQQNAFI